MKNYIFDFDGTLIDSRKIMFNALNDIVNLFGFFDDVSLLDKELEFSYPEYLMPMFLKKYELSCNNLDSCTKLYREYLKKYENKKMTFLNIENTLAQLSILKKNLFIISDRKTVDLKHLLDINRINEYFIEYIGRDICGLKIKNNSMTYLLNKYDLNPNETIYIGDKVGDLEFAKKNQISFARAAYSNEPFFGGNCDYYVLESIEDLLKI